MARSPTQKRPGRTRARTPGRRHFFWLWLGVGLVAAALLPFDHLTAIADYASRLPADAPEPVSQPIANPRDEDKR